ncbi:MAG TPA: quinoprotein relay system zinc metallohydrolase 2, partial [Steroidobacteraceae bacterium]|nr:quinoprotein relay system zinc metallohydrolase 2 [Steroidobacteraceae bacterium]
MSRREAVLGVVCGSCLPALARPAEINATPFAIVEVAPGLFFREGVDEDATAQNADAIANVGFIVGRTAVAVFDPGGSLEDGQRLRATIRKTTQLPILYVVMSHVHPDHLFGAGAFEQDHPTFIGHTSLPNSLSQRGEYYRKRLAAIMGPERAGRVVPPTKLVGRRLEIDLGGRVLELAAHSTAHTDTDLTAIDRQTGTLLASDLLFVRRVPALDGSLRGWLAQLESLKAMPAKRAVPGHGPTGVNWPQASADLERYLGTLLRETRDAIGKGVPIEVA